jgi:glutathione synthase/RimK-type ligase-like ATP-grasp enzyme
MKILIASMEEQWEIQKIKQEARKRKHKVTIVKPAEALIDTFKKKEFDVALFRPISGYATQGRALAAALYYKGIPLVDEKLAFEPGGNKFKNYWAAKNEGLSVPKTVIYNKAGLNEAKKWKGEVVFKPLGGKRGQDIFKCKAKELPKLVKKSSRKENLLFKSTCRWKKSCAFWWSAKRFWAASRS